MKANQGEGNALGNLGNSYADLGETRAAIQFYEQKLAIVREIGDRRGEGTDLWNMSLSLDQLGEPWAAISQRLRRYAVFRTRACRLPATRSQILQSAPRPCH